MARKTYWVQYLEQRWKVRHNQQTLSSHLYKETAVDAGVAVAKANQPSSLKICRMDGTIEDERTYGNDPYPPVKERARPRASFPVVRLFFYDRNSHAGALHHSREDGSSPSHGVDYC